MRRRRFLSGCVFLSRRVMRVLTLRTCTRKHNADRYYPPSDATSRTFTSSRGKRADWPRLGPLLISGNPATFPHLLFRLSLRFLILDNGPIHCVPYPLTNSSLARQKIPERNKKENKCRIFSYFTRWLRSVLYLSLPLSHTFGISSTLWCERREMSALLVLCHCAVSPMTHDKRREEGKSCAHRRCRT